jgi:hypothetical protein
MQMLIQFKDKCPWYDYFLEVLIFVIIKQCHKFSFLITLVGFLTNSETPVTISKNNCF